MIPPETEKGPKACWLPGSRRDCPVQGTREIAAMRWAFAARTFATNGLAFEAGWHAHASWSALESAPPEGHRRDG